MRDGQTSGASVLVIGAGPAGLFAAGALADLGVNVALLNRDLRPGGLAEYGIYHSKHKVKSVLRRQFGKIQGRDEIGRASCGKECRSRWSPYH